MVGESLGITQAGSSAALCEGHLLCGWRWRGVVQQPVVDLCIGGGAYGLGCARPCVVY